MEMRKHIIIEGGDVFEGSIEQFKDCFFDNADIDTISWWCGEHGYALEVKDVFDFPIAGYGNKTAFHPVGSYIGFEPGPTVFSSALTYVSCAEEAVDKMQERIDDLQAQVEELQGQLATAKVVQQTLKRTLGEEGVRQFFKDVIAEAKRPWQQRGEQAGGVIHSCSIPTDWFNAKKRGVYASYTDEFIDQLPLQECKFRLALFIANCYRQR